MPDCQFTVDLDAQDYPKKGSMLSTRMNPPPAPGCEILGVQINHRRVQPGDKLGGLKLKRIGADGTATFEGLEDDAFGMISMTLRCPNCGPTTRGIAYGPPPPKKTNCDRILEAIGKIGQRRSRG